MSIEASSLVWKHSQSKGAERLVMLCIANYINSDGLAWPSIETIHKDTQVSERQITRSIAKLESDGELQIIEKGDGRGRSTVYKIALKGDTMSPYEQHEKGDISSTKGDMVSEKGDTLSIKGDTMSPQSLEPLITKNNNAIALMNHFTRLTGYDPPNDTTNAYRDRWEKPIAAFLRISDNDLEQAKTRIEYGLNVARGGNEQGKRYSWRDPEAIKTAALSWLPGPSRNGVNGSHGVDDHAVWKLVTEAVSLGNYKGLTPEQVAAVKRVGPMAIKDRNDFTANRVRADFFKALQGAKC